MKEFIVRNRLVLFMFLLISVFLLFLFDIRIIRVFAFVSFLALGCTLLFFYDRLVFSEKKKKAQLQFCLSFRNGLYEQKGSKETYDSAFVYIRGFQQGVSYEDAKSDASLIQLPSLYQSFFKRIRELDVLGEAHLPDYRPLRERTEKSIISIEKSERKRRNEFYLSLLILAGSVFVLSIRKIRFPGFTIRRSESLPLVLTFLFPLLSISSVFFLLYWEAKKNA